MQSNKKLLSLLAGAALSVAPYLGQAQTVSTYTSSTTVAGCGIPSTPGATPGTTDVSGGATGSGIHYTDLNVASPYFGYVFYLYPARVTPPPTNEDFLEPSWESAAEERIETDCGLAYSTPGGSNDSYFGVGSDGLTYALDVEFVRAPFDAGLSLLLGAGVIGGIKRARSRKQAANATV